MNERICVVNASPLIFLTYIDGLGLLSQLSRKVVVPSAALEEVMAGQGFDPSLQQIGGRAEWLTVVPDRVVPPEVAGWDLGSGESQVLAFASLNQGCETVLDDLQARRCARSLGIATTGTLGILLRAKKAGLIQAARPLVEELLQRRMYLSRDLVESALADVDE